MIANMIAAVHWIFDSPSGSLIGCKSLMSSLGMSDMLSFVSFSLLIVIT